jgi:hypothetical protein
VHSCSNGGCPRVGTPRGRGMLEAAKTSQIRQLCRCRCRNRKIDAISTLTKLGEQSQAVRKDLGRYTGPRQRQRQRQRQRRRRQQWPHEDSFVRRVGEIHQCLRWISLRSSTLPLPRLSCFCIVPWDPRTLHRPVDSVLGARPSALGPRPFIYQMRCARNT